MNAKESLEDPHHNLTMARNISLGYNSEQGRAMTEAQYDRIQNRIKQEVQGSHGSSGWAALTLTFFGIGVTLVVTCATVPMQDFKKGTFLSATIFSFIFMVFFAIQHYLVFFKKRKATGDDICHEMDVNTSWSRTERQPHSE